jgi:PadR family transcriptional regulator PadR
MWKGDFMNVQFKKGVLELLVLAVLDKKDCYGYELVNTISENIHISEGTIYPLLRRLSHEGYFTTYLKESSEGPPRKYYKLTDQGRKVYWEQSTQWNEFIEGVTNILKDGGAKNE